MSSSPTPLRSEIVEEVMHDLHVLTRSTENHGAFANEIVTVLRRALDDVRDIRDNAVLDEPTDRTAAL